MVDTLCFRDNLSIEGYEIAVVWVDMWVNLLIGDRLAKLALWFFIMWSFRADYESLSNMLDNDSDKGLSLINTSPRGYVNSKVRIQSFEFFSFY